jgi:hypothetical protein
MKDHSVVEGECLHQIAKESGFYWETLWNHPDNADLKSTQKDPESLFPGTVVRIPVLKEKAERCLTNKAHIFRRKGPANCYGFEAGADFEGPPIFERADDFDEPPIFEVTEESASPDIIKATHQVESAHLDAGLI